MAATQFQACASATGDTSFFTATAGTVTFDTATKRSAGSQGSFKLDTMNPAVQATLRRNAVMADAGRRVSFWVLFPSVTPAANGAVASIANAAGTAVFQVSLLTTGKLRCNAAGTTSVDGNTVLSPNTWYRVGVSYVITNATTFDMRVYLNGSLEITKTNEATLTTITTDRILLTLATTLGADFVAYFDELYVDDGTGLADPGNIGVTAKLPFADSTIGFDLPIGTDPGASSRYTAVNERPLSITTGRSHRGIAWVANGTLATDAAITTLSLVAPTDAAILNKIMVASIYGNNNQVVSPPDGTWATVKEINNTANMRTTIFAKRAAAADSGATFAFTKPVDDNLLFAGLISTWKGCLINATFLDATAASSSANASSDTVTYADYDPTETSAFVIAAGQYANDLTTAGAISGTDPAYTNRLDVETSTGNDCSIFAYDGLSTGAATGARSHATTSTADAVNTGIQFGLVPKAQEIYNLQARSVGDVDLTGALVIATAHWIWAKKGATGSAGTPKILVNGSGTAITLTTSAAMYVAYTDGSTYPTSVGMESTGKDQDTFLYEAGCMVAYIPPSTATAACTVGAATASATATFAPGTHTATGAATAGAATALATATFSPGTHTATAALSVAHATTAGTATFVAPVYTATAALSIAASTASASATFSPGTKTATGAFTVGAAIGAGDATFSPGTHTATAALIAPAATASADATFAPGTKTATAALSVAHATTSASATFTAPVYDATADLTAGHATTSASATFIAPVYTATAALLTGPAEASADAEFSPGTKTATADLLTGAATADASATSVSNIYEGAANLIAAGATAAASAAFVAPVYTATADLIAPAALLAIVGKTVWTFAGVTRDCTTGAPLSGCVVTAFVTSTNQVSGTAVSDAAGNYSISVNTPAPHFLVAYLPGSPDVAGTTRNDVVGV